MKDPFNFNRIIQASHPHTGSTVLMNILTAVFCHTKKCPWGLQHIKENLICKTHQMDLNSIINHKNYKSYNLYFVISERENHEKCDEKYKNNKNVLIIDYNIIQTKTNTIQEVAKNVFPVLKDFFPEEMFPNLSENQILNNIIDRLTNMEKVYQQIKHKPFIYRNDFYGIHGSHKNRKKEEKNLKSL